jgi:cation diffusion facilitator CzcD-associated flavoprotein CzcO
VVEREGDVGGIWDASLPHSPVYRSAHMISSKPLTEFPDFPMPREYPDYPSHKQALAYLRAYARQLGLYEHIRFGHTVELAERTAGGEWSLRFSDGSARTYTGLVVAAGVHWIPSTPEVPGRFDGEIIHSCRYKTPEICADKRVLVVGAGNSGCDIAVEASHHAARTFLSVRRGYHYIPKYAFGRPIDRSARSASDSGCHSLSGGRSTSWCSRRSSAARNSSACRGRTTGCSRATRS